MIRIVRCGEGVKGNSHLMPRCIRFFLRFTLPLLITACNDRQSAREAGAQVALHDYVGASRDVRMWIRTNCGKVAGFRWSYVVDGEQTLVPRGGSRAAGAGVGT